MATAPLSHVRNPNPIPNPNPVRYGDGAPLTRLMCSPASRSGGLAVCRLRLAPTPPWKRCLATRLLTIDCRIPRPVRVAAQYEESKHSDVEVEKEKNEIKIETDESQEAWKQTLESFKEEALKLKGISEEAYEVYSKKAMVILQETAEKLKIQSEKARHDLSILAIEISEEGKEYLTSMAKNSPDEVKDIVETFTSADELKDVSSVRDFHVGIPYGSFLAFGGFLSFMLTGSIPAIRFGVILGTALLALSISSLRSWKSGKPSGLLLKGQAAIAAILFIREWLLFLQLWSFPTFSVTVVSGAILVFYIYRILMDGRSKGPSLE